MARRARFLVPFLLFPGDDGPQFMPMKEDPVRRSIAFLVPTLCVVLAVTISSVLAGGEAARDSTAKNPAKGSHEDRTYISPDAKLGGYKAVLILDPQMETTADRNEKVDSVLSELRGIVRSQLRSSLESTNRFSVVTFKEEDAKQAGKYLVCKSDSMVHFGSTALRWIVGFGAGKSRFFLVESLEDPETQEVLIKYTGYGMDWTAPMGSQIIAKMQSDAVTISGYFGGLVSKMPE